MRSIISFAVLVAVIGFSGCCGSRGAGHGLAGSQLGGRLGARAASVQSGGQQVISGDCGCGASHDVGSAAAAGSCGPGSVVTVSAPYQCDGGCSSCGDGGYTEYGDGGYESYGGGGCSSCGDSVPVVSPSNFSAPASGGCSACQGASIETPRRARGSFARGLGNGEGMGLTKNGRGLACGAPGPERRAGRQTERQINRAERQAGRSLRPERASLGDRIGAGASIGDCSEIALVSNDYEIGGGGGIAGRHISHGFIDDVRQARQGRVGGGKVGCGRGGCGHGGGLCKSCRLGSVGVGGGSGHGLCGCLGKTCAKLREKTGGANGPYGGAIPHTAQQPGQSGLAPAYAYPYYTTRGPRDFLRDNPPSIGR